MRDKCKKYADILDSVGDKLRELKAENRRIKNSDLNLGGLAHATRELKEKDKKTVELTGEKKLEHAKKNRVSSDHAEEGADLSGVIALCGKDFIDALKKVKDVWQQ